jgi:hypothetical protein
VVSLLFRGNRGSERLGNLADACQD